MIQHRRLLGRRGVTLVTLVGVTLAGCQSAEGLRPSVTAAAVECGPDLPVAVVVTGGERADPASPTDHRVIRRWSLPTGAVEVRWPADPRQLDASSATVAPDPLVVSWGARHADEVDLLVQPQQSSPATFDVDIRLRDVLAANDYTGACQVIEVMLTGADGHVETLGVRLVPSAPNGLPVEDLGPLVGRRVNSKRRLLPNQPGLCDDVRVEPNPIAAAPIMPSAAEALREFLVSPLAVGVPRPTLARPYDEVVVPGSNGVRYEHFVDWNRFVSIQVTHVATGWQVAHWIAGSC